jgi:hypothetical protein
MPLGRFPSTVPENPRDWGTVFREIVVTADAVAANTVGTSTLINDAVTDAKIRDSGALSVIGRAVNSAGDPGDISAGTDLTLLRRSGSVIGFGSITAAYVSDFEEAAQDAAGLALLDTASVNFTYDDGTGRISADVLPAGVDHDALANFFANEHIDHSTVVITAGAGLTGGGDISVTRTLNVGAGTGISVDADAVAVDTSATLTWANRQTFSGGMTTLRGVTASTPSGVAVTLQTLANTGYGTYIVTSTLNNVDDATNYSAVSLVSTNGTTAVIAALESAPSMSITLSGLAVQATQSSTVDQLISYSILRID